ncbi:kinase [Fusarium albosuccineum]|uniref:Kinase n=1 Tax=Fusarium albosuccineum TaxID=1237068 RepID=A0A8H4L1X0_9HYPO|nr:kinase [Fusarium albosuccineum]
MPITFSALDMVRVRRSAARAARAAVAPSSAASIPLPYVEGQTMDLKTPDGRHVQVIITRICSVTISPVMEVQIKLPDGGRKAILKLFDPRFGEHRERHPYSQQAEATWQDAVRSGLAKSVFDHLEHENDQRIKARLGIEGSDDDQDDQDEEEDEEDEEDDPREDEAIIFHRMRQLFETEVRAYSQLEPLQGRCIPRFIESVMVDSPDAPPDLPAFYFQVPGVLLDYIPSFMLAELPLRIPNNPLLWERIIQSAVDTAKEVNRAGVVHRDCQPRNFLVAETAPGEYQAYLIDFAQCAFRDDYRDTEDEDDEDGFPYIVYSTDNHRGIRLLMEKKLLPYRIPIKLPVDK